ncbi:MAG: hypothetical protein IKO27_04975 [Ruminococcus sp.]|nr:hypothetical protein [Ruminococcus sp.]
MKRLVRTVLAAACAAAVLVSSALPAFGERDIPGDLTTGTLEFYFRAERRLQYYYSDEYFSVSATEMNEHLRTMSLDLSFVSFVSSDTSGASGARALFEEIGFSAGDMQVDQLDIRPGKDTIGSVICHKKTPYGEVVAVSVRGAAYGEEWANSLLLGDSGDAKGFSSAAEEVLKRLRAYEEKYGLKGAKLWITGYSRGGGVADLMGKYINERTDDYGVTEDDVYVYTFEAPRASGEASGYKNIHNIMNRNDIVTKIYPRQVGMYNSGVEELIEREELKVTPMNFRMDGGFKLSPLGGDSTGTQPVKSSSMPEFEEKLLEFISSDLTREDLDKCSEHLGNLVSLTIRKDRDEMNKLVEYLTKSVGDKFSGLGAVRLAPIMMTDIGSEDFADAVSGLADTIVAGLEEGDHSQCLTEEEFVQLKASIHPLLSILAPPMLRDFGGQGGAQFEMLGTFFGNLSEIVDEHLPYNVIEMVEAMDSYHTSPPEIPPKKQAEDTASSDGELPRTGTIAVCIGLCTAAAAVLAAIIIARRSAKKKQS